MILEIAADSPVPPYEQMRTQLAAMIRTGTLSPGTRLPTIRQLSRDLAVAGGTVARAYRELEAEGLIETRGRNGTFVQPPSAGTPSALPLVEEAARGLALKARQLGIDEERTVALLRSAFASNGSAMST